MPRPSQKPRIPETTLACFAQRGYERTRIKHTTAHDRTIIAAALAAMARPAAPEAPRE